MKIRDFLAPTRGRIMLFVIIFVLIEMYDFIFTPFPGSPISGNLWKQDSATSFVIYMLLTPYIMSCLLPAFFALRKKRFFRLLSLRDFMYPRQEMTAEKPTKQQTFVFPEGTPVIGSSVPQAVAQAAPALQEDKAAPKKRKPAPKKKPKKTRKR